MGPVAARFWGDPSRDLDVIGITGTNGKTTTVAILRALLEAYGRRCEVVGTLTSRPGWPPTPPDAPALQAQLAAWRDDGVDAVRSAEHTSELQSLMRTSSAFLCL